MKLKMTFITLLYICLLAASFHAIHSGLDFLSKQEEQRKALKWMQERQSNPGVGVIT